IVERDRSAVVLDDLPREHEADPGAGRLRREERHPEIVRSRDPGAVILDLRHEHAAGFAPPNSNAALLPGRLDGILQQVDQHLLDLIGIDRDRDRRPRLDLDAVALQRRGAAHEIAELDGIPGWW